MNLRNKIKKRTGDTRYFRQKATRKRNNRIEKIAYSLEHSKFLDYLEFTKKPKWLILRNVAIGAARGVGLTVGTALVIAIGLKIMMNLISLNIPYLTEMLTDFVQFVKSAAVAVPGATDSLADPNNAAAVDSVSEAVNDAVNSTSDTQTQTIKLFKIDRSLAN